MAKRLGKKEIVDLVTNNTKLAKCDVNAVITSLLGVIADKLVAGNKVMFVGFGSFEVKEHGERMGRNPKTGEPMKIKASKYPFFKAGDLLKKRVNLK